MTVPVHPISKQRRPRIGRCSFLPLVRLLSFLVAMFLFLCSLTTTFIGYAIDISPIQNTDEVSGNGTVDNPTIVGGNSLRELTTAKAAERMRYLVQIPSSPSNSSSHIPYYLTGRSWRRWTTPFDEKSVFKSIGTSSIAPIPTSQMGWVLPRRLANATRNHGSVLLEFKPSGRQSLTIVLGRYARSLQTIDLDSGRLENYMIPDTLVDPAGNALNDLNHVYTVVVDSLPDEPNESGRESSSSSKEIWLPCGFHGDKVNREESSEYARIVHLRNMTIAVGPKLAIAGGACVAAALTIIPGEPPQICTFGGTKGNHDTGTFLPYASCYDRRRQTWHFPFGKLPTGFDHGSIAVIPKGLCHASDPARLIIFNYRTRNYGTQATEMLAYDLPDAGWALDDLLVQARTAKETPGPWYVFANVSYIGPTDEVNAPRDASGMVLADGGRSIINLGGTHYHYHPVSTPNGSRQRSARTHVKFSTIRRWNVCNSGGGGGGGTPQWEKLGDLGAETFAIQSSASSQRNVVLSCGGHAFSKSHENIPWCFLSRIPNITVENDIRHIVDETRQSVYGMDMDMTTT